MKTNKKINKTISRLKDIARPHLKTIVLVLILAIVIDIFAVIKPYVVKVIIDDYLTEKVFEKNGISVDMLGFIYIALVILTIVIDFINKMKTSIMGEKILYTLRNKIYKYSQNANINFHDKNPAGKLYSRIINDIEDISSLFKDVILTLFKDIISILAIISIMFYMSYKLSLLSLSILPFVICTSIFLTKKLDLIYTVSRKVRTELNTFFAESIYAAKIIKVFSIQKEKLKQCEHYTEEFLKKRMPSAFYEGLFPAVMTIFENIAITIIVYVSTISLFEIEVDVGVIYVFVTYIQNLFEPVNRIIDSIEVVQEATLSINKIYDILDETEYLEDFESGKELDKIIGKLEFKNVWFAYKNEEWVLKNVSFVMEPGQTFALVGKTGSGKTTITNLINRFYEIQKGQILLDGVDIKDINLRYLRQHVGIVLQDPFIFSRSIKDNIKLYKNISDREIYKAIEDASSKEFINSLPNGIEEISKERGESFSAGQKQLLAFSRIFANNPDIFILDEATANIDTNTEVLIQKSIDILSKEKTAIFIAHRLSTIVNVDKILVLSNGEIIEEGTHKELLDKGGYYSNLYNLYYESLG